MESGNHEELILLDGVYKTMVKKQQLQESEQDRMREISLDTEKQPTEIKTVQQASEKTEKVESSSTVTIHPDTEAKSESLFSLIKFVASLNAPEWLHMSLGLIFSVLAGSLITL